MSSWVRLCKVDEVKPGEMRAFDLDKEKRILLVNIGSKLYASDGICTHQYAELSEGFLSAETLRESIPRLLQGDVAEFQNPELALTVIIIAIIIGAVPLASILRQKTKGPALKAQLWGIIIGETSAMSAFVGILLASSGYLWADALASLIIGAIIAIIGANLFKENVHNLVGKTPGKDFLDKVRSAAMSVEGVIGVHDLKAEYVGPNMVHADFHIEVAGNIPVDDAELIIKRVEQRVTAEGGCQHCSIHLEPAKIASGSKQRQIAQ